MQKRLYDIGWSDERKSRGCKKRRREMPRLYHCQRERPDPRDVGEMGAEGENVEGGFEVTKRNYIGLCREDKWRKNHLSVRRWEFGKSTKDGECQLKGFCHHATSSLLAVPGRCGVCAVVSGAARSRRGHCTLYTERWMLSWRCSAPSRERGQRLSFDGSCWQRRNH